LHITSSVCLSTLAFIHCEPQQRRRRAGALHASQGYYVCRQHPAILHSTRTALCRCACSRFPADFQQLRSSIALSIATDLESRCRVRGRTSAVKVAGIPHHEPFLAHNASPQHIVVHHFILAINRLEPSAVLMSRQGRHAILVAVLQHKCVSQASLHANHHATSCSATV